MEFSNLSCKEGEMNASGSENVKRETNEDPESITDYLSENLSLTKQSAKTVEEKDNCFETLEKDKKMKREQNTGKETESMEEKPDIKHIEEKPDIKQVDRDKETVESGANSKPEDGQNSTDGPNGENDVEIKAGVQQRMFNGSPGLEEEDDENGTCIVLGEQNSMSVDLLRFLLPGLCHLTSEDEPRQILVDNELLPMLNIYLKGMLKRYFRDDTNNNVVVCIFFIYQYKKRSTCDTSTDT